MHRVSKMATPLFTSDVLRVRYYCFLSNQLSVNVVHYRVTNVVGSPVLEVMGAAWDLSVAGFYKALLCNNAIYYGSDYQVIAPGVTSVFQVNANQGSGTAGGFALPLQTTGIITKKASIPGRSGFGRIYVPFPAQADASVDGEPINSYVTRLQDLIDHSMVVLVITVGPDSITMNPGLAHIPRKPPAPPTVFTFNVLSSAKPKQKWAVQHRRGDYGRLNQLPY